MALKLYKQDSGGTGYQYVDDASPPSGFTATDDPIDWDASSRYVVGTVDLKFNSDLRILLRAGYDALGTPTSDQKKAASRWFAVDKTVRDSVYSSDEQTKYAKVLARLLNRSAEMRKEDNIIEAIKNADADDIDTITDSRTYIAYGGNKQLVISSTSYVSYSRQLISLSHGRSTEAELLIRVTVTDRNISIKVTNDADTDTYGELTGISSSGVKKVPLSGLPLSGEESIRIKAKKDATGGTNPDVRSFQLYHG